jgi:hypothetical protein
MHALLWRNLFLSLHIFSIVILSAGIVGGLLLHKPLWQAFDSAPEQLPFASKLHRFFGLCGALGGGLLLLTGVGLLASTHWVYWGTPWLSIKLALYLGLAVTANVVAKPQGKQLDALIPIHLAAAAKGGSAVALDPRLPVLRRRMALFHVAHVGMFAAVVLLAVFKP